MTDNTNHKTRDGQRCANESLPLQELRQRLTESGPWAQRFRRLVEAISEVDDPALRQAFELRAHGIGCAECEALLDVYVDAELAGLYVRQRYPVLWQHLQVCANCTVAHDLLFETLARERTDFGFRISDFGFEIDSGPQSAIRISQSEIPPPRLSFLEPPAPDTSWGVRIRSRLAGASFGLTFTLSPTYLRDLLSPPQPLLARTRQADWLPQPRLLLADTVPLEGGPVAVEVIAVPDDQDPDRLHLQATIAGSIPLPEDPLDRLGAGSSAGSELALSVVKGQALWAVVTWGRDTRAGPVDEQGQVELGEVSLAALQEALETGEGVFEITFEART